MILFSALSFYTTVGVVAVCLTKTAGYPIDPRICPNLPDGTPQYYDDVTLQCYPCKICDPGSGLSEVCGDGRGKNAECQECPDGMFQPVSAARVCGQCRKCDNTMEDLIPCTSETDRKCGPCKFGYFRYEPRFDYCVSCEDEQSRDSYPDCLLTTQAPLIAEWTPNTEPVANHSPTPTDEGPPSTPVVIAVIVMLAIILAVAIVISVVVCRYHHDYCQSLVGRLCDCTRKSSNHRTSRNVKTTTTTPDNPETEHLVEQDRGFSQNLPESVVVHRGTPITVHSSQDQLNEAIPAAGESGAGQEDYASQPNILRTSGHPQYGIQETSPTQPSRTSTPMDDSDLEDIHVPNDDTRRDSNESSASKATQTSADRNSTSASSDKALEDKDEEIKNRQFLERFHQAVKYTKEVPISSMKPEDRTLLNDSMHERTEMLQKSLKFHYLKFAELFDIPQHIHVRLETADNVLDYLVQNREVEITVADILVKLKDCGKCCDIVRHLVDNILKRQQPFAG